MHTKLKFLLVNPWVYDFSVYCFWAKPLGLLHLAEYLSQFDADINFIDCMEVKTIKHYGTGKYHSVEVEKPQSLKDIPFKYKRYGIEIEEFLHRVKKKGNYDLIFVSSIMTYWYPGVKKAIELLKELFPQTPIILGGIYATLCHEHAKKHSGADYVYYGRIDYRFDELLKIYGFDLLRKSKKIPYYEMNLYKRLNFAPLITSYGCPFNCSYCASRIIYGGFSKRDIEEVYKEIEDLYNLGIRDFAFYDDALLVDSEHYLKPLLRWVSKKYNDIRFHTPNGLHARFIDDEIAILFSKSGFKTIRLSLETVEPSRQLETGNKVSNDDFIKAVECLKKQGFTKKELGVYLMYGLPGQPLEEVYEGIEFLKSLNVRINLAEFSPIPGTESWSFLIKKGIISENLDPILTNNSVYSYLFSGYSREKILEMKTYVKNYNSL